MKLDQPITQVHALGRDGRAVRTDNFWGDEAGALEAAGLLDGGSELR